MSEITKAIEARQAQIVQLQSDIEILQRAAGIMGGGEEATAKTTSQPKAPAKAKPQPKPKAKVKQKARTKKPRAPWSAARRERMKKYWAKRRKAKG